MMKEHPRVSACLGLSAILLLSQPTLVRAEGGYWAITQLPFGFATHPVINNSQEVVWAQEGGGVYSSVRGKIADSGFNPHLANSGEVVYADWFGGPNWDLVSTTRGRLTYGAIININRSDFGVNSSGEVVYAIEDTNHNAQVYSTVRGQLTFDPTDHYSPCINDHGEIIWDEYVGGATGTVVMSSTRGILGGSNGWLWGLNNSGDYCLSGQLEDSPGYYTAPHLISSAHGAIITDPNQYQWCGGMNDAGTMVWQGPDDSVYEAKWVTRPTLLLVSEAAGLALEWRTNFSGFHVEYATNLAPSAVWGELGGSAATVGEYFHQSIGHSLGSIAFFRLSTSNN